MFGPQRSNGSNGNGGPLSQLKPIGCLRFVFVMVILIMIVQFTMIAPTHDRTVLVSTSSAQHGTATSSASSSKLSALQRRATIKLSASHDIDSNDNNNAPGPLVSVPSDGVTPRERSKQRRGVSLSSSSSQSSTGHMMALTAGGWVKMDRNPDKGTEHCIVSQGAWEGRFKLSIVETLHVRVTVVIPNQPNVLVFDLQPDDPLLPGRWYHVVLVHDATPEFTSTHEGQGQLALYIDGILMTWRLREDLGQGLAATERDITTSRCLRPSDPALFYGAMAEIHVWNLALTQGQIVSSLLSISAEAANAALPTPIFHYSGNHDDNGGHYGFSAVSIGGLSRTLDAPSTLTYAHPPNDDKVEVVISVDDGSWPYVMATVALLTARATNTAPISTLHLMASSPSYDVTKAQLSELQQLLARNKIGDAITVKKFVATDGVMPLSYLKQSCDDAWLLFLAPYTAPTPHFLTEMFANRTGRAMLTSRILYNNGRLRHSGYDLRRTSTLDEDVRLPVDPYRGVPIGYVPSLRHTSPVALEGFSVLVNRQQLINVNGFKASMAPDYHWADVSLRLGSAAAAKNKPNVIAYVPSSIVFLTYHPGDLKYNEIPVPFVDSPGRVEFINEGAVDHVPESSLSLSVSWEMYCGGSMGLEAAYMVNGIEPLVPQLRVHAPRFGRCPFIDTIGNLPVHYVEGIDRMRMRVHDHSQVVIYHRDYRELHEYVPSPLTQYTIGRYMTEVWGLHDQWVNHANSLNEVWVPSKWHAKLFVERGVERSKVQVVPEAVDVWLMDRNIITPIQLQERRGWAFLSVFKMEDRKGWRELILAYHQEFTAADDVSLIIHSYMFDVPGDAWDVTRIKQLYNEYLVEAMGDSLPPVEERPHLHIIGHYLTGSQMPQLYRACDAYVGPSYGEGWGLPYHEAMSMSMPVIATAWSGQTEFLNDDVAYMVDVEKLVPSSVTDSWFGGFHWAKPSVTSLRKQMRAVFSDQDAARAKGRAAREWIINRFAVEPVSQHILLQLRRIERSNHPMIAATAPAVTTSSSSIKSNVSDESVNWVTHSETIELCRAMPLAIRDTEEQHRSKAQILQCAIKRGSNGAAATTKQKPCMRVGMISTIPPTKCGIAIFSSHLFAAFQQVAGHLAQFDAIPIVDDLYALPEHQPHVEIENNTVAGIGIGPHIRRNNPTDYVRAAERINNEYDALIIQHEFGIFGGHAGAYILCLARLLRIPLLINFHTVHEHLDRNTHAVLMALDQVATHTLTMTRMGARFMRMFHATPVDKLSVIAHGVPKLPSDMNRAAAKKKWQLEGQFVMLSSGFIGPNKGYHHTLRALAQLLPLHPNITLIIAGEPHLKCGRICRDYLVDMKKTIDELDLSDHVRLMTAFIPSSTLHSLMAAADVYIAAYTESEVSSSGTVSIAMTAGRVVVATPFIYTKEALGHGRGILLPSFNDVPLHMTRAISQLITQPWRMAAMEKASMIWQQSNTWTSVAQAWLPLLGLAPAPVDATSEPATP